MGRALVLAGLVLALALATPAGAKEGAQAQLLRRLPVHAKAGAVVTVRWTVDVPGDGGTRVPFNAIGMFVRLVGRQGTFTQATAPQLEGPPYSVRIRVPTGGIRVVRFGLHGSTDMWFAVRRRP